jgi:hypothetical protein
MANNSRLPNTINRLLIGSKDHELRFNPLLGTRRFQRWIVFPLVAVCAPFLIVACGGGGSTNPKTTASLSAAPTTVASGGASTLTWSSTNATSCTASGGWSGSRATTGTQSTGVITATTSYSLTCTGAGRASAVATVTVTVSGAATVTLTASPVSVASGGVSTLAWSSTNATSCTASGGWSGTKTPSGTQGTGALTVPTAYSLICTGTGGASKVSTVTVIVVPMATITANPSVVMGGGSSALTWSSTNATSCTATGGWSGTKATSGTQSFASITATTAYSLTCTGAGGTSSVATATVTISDGTVAVSPKTAAITLSRTQLFTATVPGGGAASWSVDGVAGGNATVGTISAAGLYTAGTAAGAHTVLATSVADTSHSGSAVAAVTDLAGMYTYHNDLARDGVNSHEFALTTANVNTASFGRLLTCAADGAIYAQPLWVANLMVNGAKHNVVFVATQHDSLYAFDADAGSCATLWSGSMLSTNHGASAGETTVPTLATDNFVGANFGSVAPEIGITGTPVIDPATNTLYVVSKSVNAQKTTYYQRLHAIDATTGNEKAGSPVLVTATYPGSGDGGTTVTFTPRYHHLRCGLALVNGVVYLAWTGHEDALPYYGWIMGYTYSGTQFTQVSVLNVTPNVHQGGIWMSGGALAADSNNFLYALTANGGFDVTNPSGPKNDYGDSLLQLTGSLAVNQYFTPSDQATDNSTDTDFGSGGAAILADLPAGSAHPHLVMGGGKDGSMYVIDRDTLGGFGDNAAVQQLDLQPTMSKPKTDGNFATGAFWNNNFYIAANNRPLTSWALDTSSVMFTLSSSSTALYGFPGATPSVSAAGAQSGIVWIVNTSQNCLQGSGCGPAVLHAYDATDMTKELWNSGVGADAAGNAVKFAVPTIANGRVYVGTRGTNMGAVTPASGELDVYGLKP